MRCGFWRFGLFFGGAFISASVAHAQQTPTPPPLPPPIPQTETEIQPGANLDAPNVPARPVGSVPPPGVRPPFASDRAGAAPRTDVETRLLNVRNADKLLYSPDNRIIYLAGNVSLESGGYTVTSDRATFDRKKRTATVENNVVFKNGEQTIYADYIQINLRNGAFITREGRTIIPAADLGGSVLQDVRVSGKTYERVGREYIATDGLLTTCDFPNPHYKIGFRRATIIPNNRIILRNAVIYRYEKAVARLAYLVIPIQDYQRNSYFPQVGRTEEEGYFAKSALGYLAKQNFPGYLYLDLLQKKGVGLGVDQAYKFAETAAGTVYLYNLNDKNRKVNNTNGRINHTQRIDQTTTANLSTDFQNNSYNSISPASKTQATTLTATRNAGNGTTNATFGLSTSSFAASAASFGASSNRNVTYDLNQQQGFGQATNVTFRVRGSDTSNSNSSVDSAGVSTRTTSGRIEQNGEITARSRLGIFDLDASANRLLTSKGTGTAANQGNFYSGLEKLPEFNVGTDSSRFGKTNAVPIRFTLGVGKYLERSNNVTTRRAIFSSDANPRPLALTPGGALSLSLGSSFRQAMYGNGDTAQYVLNTRPQLVQRLGRGSQFSVNYNYIRPYGSTPVSYQQDTVGSSNRFQSVLGIAGYRTRLNLQTGYDLQRARQKNLIAGQKTNPFDNLSIQLGFRPDDIVQTSFTTAYDINSGKLQTVNNRIRVRTAQGFALNTGISYEPMTRKFPQITETLQMPLFGRDLQFSALTGYNGISHKFDYKTFGLIQSFHDYEYVLGYRDQSYGFSYTGNGARSDRGFTFTIRLKAFPALQPQTTGQFGTALDTGTGDVF